MYAGDVPPLARALLLVIGLTCSPVAGEPPTVSGGSPTPLSSGSSPLKLAPFKERLNSAKSVKVQTDILGIELDASLQTAHAKLDSLGNAAKPAIEGNKEAEHGEEEHKVLWQLVRSDFSSVYVKADEKNRIIYIMGLLRPGKEIPFENIGEVEKAPISSKSTVAWDVVRPRRPLIRVVARGENGRAASITMFIVKRAPGDS